MHRIAIVDPNEASRESLRTMLLGVDFVWLEAECARYEYFFDVIQQSTPDLVIIALDGDKTRALGMVGQLAADYPRLPILTVSSDSQALLQSLQRGAKHFLTQPVTLEDLVSGLTAVTGRCTVQQRAGRRTANAGRTEDGRPDHQRARLPRRCRVHEHRGQPGGDAGRLAGKLGRPDRPRPGDGRRGHRGRTAGRTTTSAWGTWRGTSNDWT